jgi:hypothetical protein
MTDMEAKVKQEVAELDRLIAAEEYKLSVLSGERPATPEYSRVRPRCCFWESFL